MRAQREQIEKLDKVYLKASECPGNFIFKGTWNDVNMGVSPKM